MFLSICQYLVLYVEHLFSTYARSLVFAKLDVILYFSHKKSEEQRTWLHINTFGSQHTGYKFPAWSYIGLVAVPLTPNPGL